MSINAKECSYLSFALMATGKVVPLRWYSLIMQISSSGSVVVR